LFKAKDRAGVLTTKGPKPAEATSLPPIVTDPARAAEEALLSPTVGAPRPRSPSAAPSAPTTAAALLAKKRSREKRE
jgi:hypothetical protein